MLSPASPRLDDVRRHASAQLDDVRRRTEDSRHAAPASDATTPSASLQLHLARRRIRRGTRDLLGAWRVVGQGCLVLAARLVAAPTPYVAILAALALSGCATVERVGVGVGATSQGDLSGSVQIYFRDAAGGLRTARLPQSTLARTRSLPVVSDLDLPTGLAIPTMPHAPAP